MNESAQPISGRSYEAVKAKRWSFSAFEQYSRCGYQYKLDRIDKVPTRPSMAAVAGSAFHQWTESYDFFKLDGLDTEVESAEDIFTDLVVDEEESSGIPRDQWQISGRKTKDKPNKEDFECWRDTLLPDLCERYINWRYQSPWQIATDLPPDGHGRTVGIEYALDFFVGDTKIRAIADRIFMNEHGMLGVVDIKTWSRARGSVQLPTYVLGCRKAGIDVKWAGYYNARTGAESQPQTFDSWTEDRFLALYDQARQMEAQGFYLPRPSDDCKSFCKVAASCEYAV